MIKSMTGYGRAEKVFDDYKITVDIKTVNNRYLDLSIKAYKQYVFVEETVRECVSSKISRGKTEVYLQYDFADGDDKTVTLNEDAAKEYYLCLEKLNNMFNLNENITLEHLATFSDIFNIEKKERDKDKITADTKQVVMAALDDLTANRQREGKRLKTFFDNSISHLEDTVKLVDKRSPETVKEYSRKMHERISELLADVKYDEARLLTEVAIFADKVNITEEIIRFNSHLDEFKLLLEKDEPVGRKLDFIIQELNREANTMGSKCTDIVISKDVVELKAEIEKLREQVQNIE